MRGGVAPRWERTCGLRKHPGRGAIGARFRAADRGSGRAPGLWARAAERRRCTPLMLAGGRRSYLFAPHVGGKRLRPAKTPAVKGRWAGVPIDPLVYGSCSCTFALRNLHKSPGGQVGASPDLRWALGSRPPPSCGDWCRFRAAGRRSDVHPTCGRAQAAARERLRAGFREGRRAARRPRVFAG